LSRCVRKPLRNKKPPSGENLIRHEDFYHTIAEASFAGIYVVQDGRFSYLNRNAASYAGYTPIELTGRDAFSIVHHEDRDLVNKLAREMLKGQRTEPYEFRIINKDWQVRWIMETVTPITYQGKPAILGNSMDVTEKKRTEEALNLSENRYRTLIETTHDLVFTVDGRGYFNYINPQFQKTLGYTDTDLLGKPFTTIVAPDCLIMVRENFKAGIKGGIIPPYEVELLHKDGKKLLVEFLTTTIWDGQRSRAIGRFGIGRDITERKRAEEERREVEKRLADMINFLPDATLAIDQQGKVIAWNQAITEMTGINPEEMLGKGDYEYAIPFYGNRRPILIDLILSEGPETIDTYDIIRKEGACLIAEPVHPNTVRGKEVYLWAKASPLFDTGGKVVGAIESIRDVTDIKKTEQALRESEGNYRQIFEHALEGMFQSSPEGRFIRVNPNLAKMCGFGSPEEMIAAITDMANQHYVYPEDREIFKETMQRQGFIEDFEHATYRKDGSVFWVSVSAREVRDDLGRFLYYEGNHIDITERKQAQDALKASEEKYRTIIESIGDGYYEVDMKGTIQFINNACARISGVPRHELMGMSFREFALEGEGGELYNAFHRAFLSGEPEKGLVSRIKRPDGKEQYVEISVSLKKDSKGKPTGFMGILQDVTERKKAEETIQWMAYHDALTGLPNRILFHDRLVLAMTQAKRNSEQLAVVMMDLDKFKEINDSYGHYMGDCILCAFVESVKKQLREGDTVARTGGDEFMMILPGIHKAGDVKKLGAKIITAFQEPVEVGGQSFVITTSLGVALYPRDGENFDTLVNNADTAMYQAKSKGGNTCIVYGEGAGNPQKS